MIAAYCWPQSLLPGEAVNIHCATTAARFHIKVVRQGASNKEVYKKKGIVGDAPEIPELAASEGCNWPVSTSFKVQSHWPSGFYLVSLFSEDGDASHAFFVVRAAVPGDALLVLSTSTWAAYNTWGGPSYYTGGHVSSLQRPLPKGFLARENAEVFRAARMHELPDEAREAWRLEGYSNWSVAAGWPAFEQPFVNWAENSGIRLDYAVSADLENPELLPPYRCYLSVGHDEYWSEAMRDSVEDFVRHGGNAAFFSGNTAFWQIRYESDHSRQVCYKLDLADDPVLGTSRERTLSTMWSDPLVGRPENSLTGVSFTRGGYAHMNNSPKGSGGYTVWQPDHWAFEGLSLFTGDLVGTEPVVVGYECDGCELKLEHGLPVPTHRDGTPENFAVLATAPAHLWETREGAKGLPDTYVGELNWVAERLAGDDTPASRRRFANGNAVMGTFRKGKGEVFTTGCTDWVYGLKDSSVARISRNVLRRFLAKRQPL